MTHGDVSTVSPFVGLRPFESDESTLFFGRAEQTVDLLEKLHASRFVAVIGSSGSGKSSLVRAGLIPKLLGGFLVRERDRWFIAVLRPGEEPVRNLADALHYALADEEHDGTTSEDLHSLLLASDIDAVTQAIAPALESADGNLLVLVDQFEEIFRFAYTGEQSTEEHTRGSTFVSDILGLAAQRTIPVYIVLTMRSDFVGDCALYQGLPEAINLSVYLVPRMTRRQTIEAIEGPVRLSGGTISQRVIERLLDDGGVHPDQLPVLQHALMRIWAHWRERTDEHEPIDIEDYEVIGGLASALNIHLESVFAELDSEGQEIARMMFQCLTVLGPDNRAVRRPTRVPTICDVTTAEYSKVVEVVDTFRCPGRSFLMPPPASALDEHTVIDISHESLIRNWNRLDNWVSEEASSADTYMRLVGAASRYETGQSALFRGPDLELALIWRDRARPTTAWADRYSPGLDRAIRFLEESLSEHQREEAEHERLRQQRLGHSRTSVILAFLVGVMVGALAFSWFR